MRAPAFAWVLLLSTSCAVEEIVAATSERHEDGGRHPQPHPCMSNADCRLDEFCSKATCEAAQGDCARRPAFCDASPNPFCGCDGITYFNDCWRETRGIAAATRGECEVGVALSCGGAARATCPPESFCAEVVPGPADTCPADATGDCWVLPPVCGSMDPINRWMPCGPPAPCVDTCTAFRSGIPHWRAPGCP